MAFDYTTWNPWKLIGLITARCRLNLIIHWHNLAVITHLVLRLSDLRANILKTKGKKRVDLVLFWLWFILFVFYFLYSFFTWSIHHAQLSMRFPYTLLEIPKITHWPLSVNCRYLRIILQLLKIIHITTASMDVCFSTGSECMMVEVLNVYFVPQLLKQPYTN